MCCRLLVLPCVGLMVCGWNAPNRVAGSAEPARDPPVKVNKLTDLVQPGEPVPSPLTFSSNFERIDDKSWR